ncbi:MAG: hypothetical protein JST39_17940 [Bacteroidetes bacterium]|nr:hypothetical protein [Bacteroidota bacterium]
MDSIEECVQRVSQRVKDGGHMVPEDSIVYNFKHGFANLYTHYREFDTVTLVDNSIATNGVMKIPSRLLTWKAENIEMHESEFPAWVKKFVEIITGAK